jgi:hypothetical protein
MRKIQDSPAVQLIEHLWNHRQEATGHSWLRMNQGLHQGLMLAVKLGLTFEEGDINTIAERFRGGYWFGDNFESFYTCAVVYGNRSAWKAYEAHRNRTPFIWTPARLSETWGGGGQGINNPPRLTVGCEFQWKGERVKVTSFNDDKEYLVAQSYKWNETKNCEKCGKALTYPKQSIVHRYTITHEDLKEAKKAIKAKEKENAKG